MASDPTGVQEERGVKRGEGRNVKEWQQRERRQGESETKEDVPTSCQ